jgi:hypothetical protein
MCWYAAFGRLRRADRLQAFAVVRALLAVPDGHGETVVLSSTTKVTRSATINATPRSSRNRSRIADASSAVT